MRALVVVNPQARRGRRAGESVVRALREHGIEPVASDADCIVVAGGDGTIASQIDRAVRLGLPLGIIPLGTFNELARTLGIPLDVREACGVIAGGATRAIDIARANGVAYINEASLGISSRIARAQRPQEKQRFGWFAVAIAFLRGLGRAHPMDVTVEHDGAAEAMRAVQVTIANSHRFGGFVAVDDSAIDDGWLDLYAIEVANPLQAVSVVHALISHERKPVPGVRTFRSTAFTVRSRRMHRVTADGEPAGTTPAHFEVEPLALRVYVPAASPA